MECNFVVGQTVICVDDGDRDKTLPENAKLIADSMDGLTKGRRYTIRDVFFDEGWESVSVRLVEIVRPNSICGGVCYEAGYDPDRFRPVAERKTDISIFTNMLRDVHADA